MSGGSGGSGADRGERGDGEEKEEVPTVERVVTVVSVGFTLVLVGLVVWQSLSTPTDVGPQVRVTGLDTGPTGDIEVSVELVNPGDVGLSSVTVSVDCTTPPPELTFENVPASGRRQGTVICPANAADPNATIAGWQEA